MQRSRRNLVSRLAALAGFALLPCGDGAFAPAVLGAEPDKDAVSQQVLDAWTARQSAVKRIQFSLTGERNVARGSRSDDPVSPPVDLKLEHKRILFFDLEKGLVRIEEEDYVFSKEPDQPPRPTHRVFLYNPGKSARFKPAETRKPVPGRREIVSANLDNDKARSEIMRTIDNWPVLWSLGILLEDQLKRPGFQRALTAKDFDIESEIDIGPGKALVSLLPSETDKRRATSTDEWTVDLSRGSAVVGYKSRTRPGVVVFGSGGIDIEITELKEYEFGWFPHKWKHGTDVKTEYTVAEIVFNEPFSESTFQVPRSVRTPGALVIVDGEISKIGSDGKTLLRYTGEPATAPKPE